MWPEALAGTTCRATLAVGPPPQPVATSARITSVRNFTFTTKLLLIGLGAAGVSAREAHSGCRRQRQQNTRRNANAARDYGLGVPSCANLIAKADERRDGIPAIDARVGESS